jgi:tetratricopeptide (TPR) repeat protein
LHKTISFSTFGKSKNPAFKMRIIPLVFSLLISAGFVNAQSLNQEILEIDIIKVYEKVVEDGYSSAQIYEKLATSYYIKNDFANAVKWFEKLLTFTTTSLPNPSIYLYYAKSLEALENHEKARKYRSIHQSFM